MNEKYIDFDRVLRECAESGSLPSDWLEVWDACEAEGDRKEAYQDIGGLATFAMEQVRLGSAVMVESMRDVGAGTIQALSRLSKTLGGDAPAVEGEQVISATDVKHIERTASKA